MHKTQKQSLKQGVAKLCVDLVSLDGLCFPILFQPRLTTDVGWVSPSRGGMCQRIGLQEILQNGFFRVFWACPVDFPVTKPFESREPSEFGEWVWPFGSGGQRWVSNVFVSL